ncbi:hypothetical protein EJ063_02565 [Vibrio aquaticus]|uniref:Uncharacterized protein n=1 Tax=Vibrio aquaticus TaxID=2496559 RepID=A0A3S0N7I1_9VIBR|nr:hypothetical protein [Vibrio aquaticus]RTZ17688.1 hypothetical protein EJ063_02565 [Vibrio aquaticus]
MFDIYVGSVGNLHKAVQAVEQRNIFCLFEFNARELFIFGALAHRKVNHLSVALSGRSAMEKKEVAMSSNPLSKGSRLEVMCAEELISTDLIKRFGWSAGGRIKSSLMCCRTPIVHRQTRKKIAKL